MEEITKLNQRHKDLKMKSCISYKARNLSNSLKLIYKIFRLFFINCLHFNIDMDMDWQIVNNSNFEREQDREKHHTQYTTKKAIVIRP